MSGEVFIGTAGWTIPKAHSKAFPIDGTGLARYASVFNATEINATFYRSPRISTLERWRDSVPESFRFSVKVPKIITHEQRLLGSGAAFAAFAEYVSVLGNRLGPLLLQLPPKLEFRLEPVEGFLREASQAAAFRMVFEPRHASWFCGEAEGLLAAYGVSRVGADPERCLGAGAPGGAGHLGYWRLHGSPRMYFSPYDDAFITNLALELRGAARPAWCIFDNTASGAAAGDALRLMAMQQSPAVPS